MTIGINNFSPPANFTSGPIPSPAPGLAPNFIPAFNIALVPDAVTALLFGAVAGRIAPMVINLHITFYYGKAVLKEDLTNSKLYIKRII